MSARKSLDLIEKASSRRQFLKASAVAAGGVVLAACARKEEPAEVTGPSSVAAVAAGETRLTTVLDRGKVIVAATSEYPPMGFVDEDGVLTGFDIGIARLIAWSLFGDEEAIEFKTIGWDARWATVQAGQADIGIMSSTVWHDRVLKVAWTRQYIDSALGVLVNKASGIKTMDDLNKKGRDG